MTHIMPDLKYIPSLHTLDEDTFIGLYKEKRLEEILLNRYFLYGWIITNLHYFILFDRYLDFSSLVS